MDSDDLALQALLAVRGEVAPHLDENLLRQCYAIQRRHQFRDDRALSAAAMERLVDASLATDPPAG